MNDEYAFLVVDEGGKVFNAFPCDGMAYEEIRYLSSKGHNKKFHIEKVKKEEK